MPSFIISEFNYLTRYKFMISLMMIKHIGIGGI